MKKIFYLTGICLLAIACKQAPNSIALNGTEITANKVLVHNFANNEVIDTINVEDGNFTYSYDLKGDPEILMLKIEPGATHYLIAEKGNATLVGDRGSIAGTPMNDRVSEFINSYMELSKGFNEKRKALYDQLEQTKSEPTAEQRAEFEKIFNEFTSSTGAAIKEYYKQDNQTIVGALELLFLHDFVEEAEFMQQYEQAGEIVKKHPLIADLIEKKESKKRTSVGGKVVDLVGINPSDTTQTLKLSDFTNKDRYILLDFWASWCGPCRAAMPEIKNLHDKYFDKGLDVIGVVVDDQIDKHLQLAKSLNVTWPQIFDNKKEFNALYGIEGIPTLILIDKDGTILERTHDKNIIKERIESLVKS